MNQLSIIVVGPDEELRREMCQAAALHEAQIEKEFAIYPDVSKRHVLSGLTDADALMVELDTDPEAAINLIRQTVGAADGLITVIVYSAKKDADLLVRCMQAGSREFLSTPLDHERLAEALERAAARRPTEPKAGLKRRGRSVAFLGAKGGVGATTLAANYALALRKESGEDVCLVDLNTQLGDAAMALGLEPRFSVVDALSSANRLDHDFLSALLAEHSSGLSVLAGPDTYDPDRVVDSSGLDALFDVLGQYFSYTVLDAGVGGEFSTAAVRRADLVYVVVQADVATLRNAQRIVSHFQADAGTTPRMELVLNRVGAKEQLSEAQVESTLGLKVRWSIPNDFRRIQDALNRGISLAENESPVASSLKAMARAFTGKAEEPKGGGWLSAFRKAPAKG